MLGQDRLEVRWEAVMFLFNVVKGREETLNKNIKTKTGDILT